MKAKIINKTDLKDILVSSLPTRPTAPRSLGGRGYGAREMKEAFDKLPLYIIERYNELIDDVTDFGEDSLASAIPSGIKEGHTLHDLLLDVASGELATYFSFLGKSLFSHIMTIYGELSEIKLRISESDSEKEGEEKCE